MIANLLIIAFVLGMAYIWSVYGLFSAFLQLILVICAGSIALAVWEPLTVGFLLGRMPAYAWGVGLLGPFILALVILRVACDGLVRGNVHFPRLVSGIGGGVCGLLSGILIAGLAWIGLSFLPLKPTLGGAQNYQVSLNGMVVPTESGGLWFRVDKMAAGFFSGLSGSAFGTSKPLHLYQPDLAWQAGVYRLHTDANASYVARPTGVDVTAVYAQPAPIQGLDIAVADAFGPDVNTGEYQLVVVDTVWSRDPGTYDGDSALRIAPSQVRLVAFQGPARDPRPVLVPPRGYAVITDFQTKARTFHPLTTDQADARTNQQSETFAFVFLVPADAEVKYALLRHLRVDLPAVERDPEQFAVALGTPLAPADTQTAADTQPAEQKPPAPGTFRGEFVQEIALTNALPHMFNRNNASALRYAPDSTAIESGDATVTGRAGGLARNTRVDSIYVPSHQAAVRVRISADTARGIFGQALNTARSAAGVWLTDERGQQHRPIAWVLHQGGDTQIVHVDLNKPIQSANELPTSQMAPGHALYLYFALPRPTRITSYQIGDKTESIEPPIEAQ